MIGPCDPDAAVHVASLGNQRGGGFELGGGGQGHFADQGCGHAIVVEIDPLGVARGARDCIDRLRTGGGIVDHRRD